MPFVHIHYIASEKRTKAKIQKLAKMISDAIIEVFEVPKDVVWIEFSEVPPTHFAIGGTPYSEMNKT